MSFFTESTPHRNDLRSNILRTSHLASIYWVPMAVFIHKLGRKKTKTKTFLQHILLKGHCFLHAQGLMRNKEDPTGSPPIFRFMWNTFRRAHVSSLFKISLAEKVKGVNTIASLLPCLEQSLSILFCIATVKQLNVVHESWKDNSLKFRLTNLKLFKLTQLV